MEIEEDALEIGSNRSRKVSLMSAIIASGGREMAESLQQSFQIEYIVA